jgi:cytochrome c6
MNNFGKKITLISSLFALLQANGAVSAQTPTEEGQKIFNEKAVPACAQCHTLKHADAWGESGPILDDLKPTEAMVIKAVKNGVGQMPAFNKLTDAQIKLVAKYVSDVAGK